MVAVVTATPRADAAGGASASPTAAWLASLAGAPLPSRRQEDCCPKESRSEKSGSTKEGRRQEEGSGSKESSC